MRFYEQIEDGPIGHSKINQPPSQGHIFCFIDIQGSDLKERYARCELRLTNLSGKRHYIQAMPHLSTASAPSSSIVFLFMVKIPSPSNFSPS